MADPAQESQAYRRLTRARSRTVFGIVSSTRSSLWLGKDHLLNIDTNGYTETYKRFAFRDIQAFTLRKTARWQIQAGILGALAALFGAIAITTASAGEPVVAWIMGGLAALFALGALLEVARGPTCICELRTAVQAEELPSLDRVRRAHKALSRLRPFIAEAQGLLTPEEIPARMQAWVTAQPAPAPFFTPPAATPNYIVDDPNAPPRIVS